MTRRNHDEDVDANVAGQLAKTLKHFALSAVTTASDPSEKLWLRLRCFRATRVDWVTVWGSVGLDSSTHFRIKALLRVAHLWFKGIRHTFKLLGACLSWGMTDMIVCSLH